MPPGNAAEPKAQAGATIEELCRRHGFSQATYYKWKQKFGGLQINDVRRLRLLEDENRKLKKMVTDLRAVRRYQRVVTSVQSVQRNAARLPVDFAFCLTNETALR